MSFEDPLATLPAELQVSVPAFVASGLSFVFIFFLYTKIWNYKVGADVGVPMIDELAKKIKSGAVSFLITEYSYLSVFVALLGATLYGLFFMTTPIDPATTASAVSISFVSGAALSASAGWWGMMVATDGNAKTTTACAGNKALGKKGTLNDGLTVAFTTGAVMGFAVVGLGLTGVSACYTVLSTIFSDQAKVMQCLAGFGFGASSIALFARVAGGIYTKAADVGADLVGKVEADIDEDDPHNPAVIADNVGDNVGDVAGMGADLFESYVGSIIAAATLAVSQSEDLSPGNPMAGKATEGIKLAFLLPAVGIICSIIGFFAVSTQQEGKGWDVQLGQLMWALEKGMYLAGLCFTAGAYVCTVMYLGLDIAVWYTVIVGLFLAC
jgi:Na+/H+-translocating membrane pyrophosphatase